MSWKIWVTVGAILLLLFGGAAAVFGYLFVYPEMKLQRYYRFAEDAYAKERWGDAKNGYAWYLTGHPEDIAAQERYAECSLKGPGTQRKKFADAGNAYMQIARQDVTNAEYRKRALDFLKRYGYWADLETMVKLYLLRDPEGLSLHYDLAVALEHLGRANAALEEYQKLAEKYDELIAQDIVPREVFSGMARLWNQQGLRDLAIRRLQEYEKKYGEDPQFQIQMAEAYLLLKEKEKSIGAVRLAIMLAGSDGLDYDGLIAAADVYRLSDESNYALAITQAESALDKDPSRPEAYITLAYLYNETNDLDKAISTLKSASPELRNTFENFYILLAEMQLAKSLVKDAAETAQSYKDAYPEDKLMFEYFRARILLAGGDLLGEKEPNRQLTPAEAAGKSVDAALRFEQVATANPGFARAQLWQAQAHLNAAAQFSQANLQDSVQEQLKSARNVLEMYVRNQPEATGARALLERLSAGTLTVDPADAAKTLLEDENAAPERLLGQAQELLSINQSGGPMPQELAENTEQLLDRALKADPENLDTMAVLAEFYLGQGRDEEAKSILAKGEADGPEPRFRRIRAELALKEGRLDEAKALRDAALEAGELSGTGLLPWANLFKREGQLEEGFNTISGAAAKEQEPAERALIEVEKISLANRSGDFERAQELIEELAPRISEFKDANDRLAAERVALADNLISLNTGEDLRTAGAILDTVDQTKPGLPAAKLVRARLMLLENGNDSTGAAAMLKDLTEESTPAYVRGGAFLLLHNLAMSGGDLQTAKAYADQAERIMPLNLNAQLAVAESMLALGAPSEARGRAEKVLSNDPGNVRALACLVRAEGALRQTAQAERYFSRLEAAVADKEGEADTLVSLRAWLSRLRGDTADAEKLLRERIANAPEDYDAVQELAYLVAGKPVSGVDEAAQSQQEKQQLEDAVNIVKAYVDIKPNNAQAHTLIGQLYAAQKEKTSLVKASSSFALALLVSRDYAPALRGMIDVHRRLGNVGAALGLFDRYIEKQPDDNQTLLNIVDALQRQGNGEAALESINRYLAKNKTRIPGDDVVFYAKAQLLSAFEDDERQKEALDAIEKAIEIQERPAYTAAECLLNLRLGNLEVANEKMRRLSETQGQVSPAIDIAMGEEYLKKNDLDNAQRFADRVRNKLDGTDTALEQRLERLDAQIKQLKAGQ